MGFGLLEANRRSSEGDSFEDVHVAEESGNTIVVSRDHTALSQHSSQLQRKTQQSKSDPEDLYVNQQKRNGTGETLMLPL